MWVTTLWGPESLPLQWCVVIGASLVAAAFDLRSRTIPNLLTAPLACTGIVWACASAGAAGLLDSVLACLLLAAPFIVLFVFAGGGAGDAKLMGAIGAWLGPADGAVVLVSVSLVGMLLALTLSAARGRLASTLQAVAGAARSAYASLILRTSLRRAGTQACSRGARQTMPYGVAILGGVLAAAAGVQLWNGS